MFHEYIDHLSACQTTRKMADLCWIRSPKWPATSFVMATPRAVELRDPDLSSSIREAPAPFFCLVTQSQAGCASLEPFAFSTCIVIEALDRTAQPINYLTLLKLMLPGSTVLIKLAL